MNSTFFNAKQIRFNKDYPHTLDFLPIYFHRIRLYFFITFQYIFLRHTVIDKNIVNDPFPHMIDKGF